MPDQREEAAVFQNGWVGERGGRRLQPRGASVPTELAASGGPGHYRSERICRCVGSNRRSKEDVVVRVGVGTDAVWVPLDTGARSIWVERGWFEQHGGTWEKEIRRNSQRMDTRWKSAAEVHSNSCCGERNSRNM